MKEVELYLHIPFCVKKCAYCDFLSAPADDHTVEIYIQRLCQEMAYYKEAYSEYQVDSVFIGGGTPTILNAAQIARVMKCVYDCFAIKKNAEITMECNPGTISREKAKVMRYVHINRVSFGLQSANDQELQLLGRIHTWADFLKSYEIAKLAGFSNVNVDLMSALPGQTTVSWEQTLTAVCRLKPAHISAYSLIIEEGTPFYEQYHVDDDLRARGKDPQFLPSEEEERLMYELTAKVLESHGYHRYEISNYATLGCECRHNIGYWTGRNYLGLGLGSASLIEGTRFRNTENLKTYLEQPFSHEEIQMLSRESQMEEYMFLGLRMMRGISTSEFAQRFGTSIDTVYGEQLEKLMKQRLLLRIGERILLTDRGIDVSNQVFTEFLH